MHVRGNHQRIAALIRHTADAAYQIADGTGLGAAIGGARRRVRLAAEPRKIAVLLRFLRDVKTGLQRGAGLRLLGVLVSAILIRLGRDRAQGGRTVFGEQNIQAVRNDVGLGKFQAEAHRAFTRLRGRVELFEKILDHREIFFRVRRNDDRIGSRFGGDVNFAVKPAHVIVGGGGVGIVAEIIPIAALLRFFQKQFIEHIRHVRRARIFQRINFRREAPVGNRLVQLRDHLGDAFHLCGRSLDDHRVAAAVGHHAEFFRAARIRRLGIAVEVARDRRRLPLVQILQLLGHVLRVGVFQNKCLRGFFLRVLRVERADEFCDRIKIRQARKHDQRIGAVIRRHINRPFAGGLAAHFLIERCHFLGELVRRDVLQRQHAHRHVFGPRAVERVNQLARHAQVVRVIRDDDLVRALVHVHRRLVRQRRLDALLQVRRLDAFQRENFHELLPAGGHVCQRAGHQFGTHFRLLAGGDDHDGIAQFHRRKTLQRQRAIHHVDRLAHRHFFIADDRQLALHARMFHHRLPRRLRQPLRHHVHVRALKTDLNPVVCIGFRPVNIGRSDARFQRLRRHPRPVAGIFLARIAR